MPTYNTRDFHKTFIALTSDQTAGIAPVSRFADILIGEYIADIVWAQMQVGIPDEKTVEGIIQKSTHPEKSDIPFYFDEKQLAEEQITKKQAFDNLYKTIEFQSKTRPMNVIEVCYEPETPSTMQHYLQAACRYRDEHQGEGLVVLLGTDQSKYRFKFMVENFDLSDLRYADAKEVAELYKRAVESMNPTAELKLDAGRVIIDKKLFEYATKTGCTPDGIASTSMTPLRDKYIRETCGESGIVLIPNIDFSPTNLLECLESVVIQNGRYQSGAPIQKVFPFGAINPKGWVESIDKTYPNAKIMTTGGADKYKGRELIFYGVTLIGASEPAKKKAIVTALYRQYVLKEPREKAWEDFIREASIFATEVHIGRILRKRHLQKQDEADAKLNKMFKEVEAATEEK